MLAVGRTFDVVTQSQLLDPHLGLRADLHAPPPPWYLADWPTVEERAESAAAYALLGEGLSALDAARNGAGPGRDRPRLRAPPARGQGLPARARIVHRVRGGGRAGPERLCRGGRWGRRPGMRPRGAGAVAISNAALKAMRHFQRVPLDEAGRGHDPARRSRGERHLHATVSAVLERELRTRDFLDEVSRLETVASPAAGATSVLR